jgi:dTDP-4-amino-4,6-dideoxygalactose transaminase
MPTSEQIAERAIHNYFNKLSANQSMRQMHLYGGGAVAALETKIKKHYGMKFALCLSNATTGLMALAVALELKNVQFITSPYTYGATISGWLMQDNKPVFADIDAQTLTLDCHSTAKAITSKTKAILATDIYGIPHDSAGMRKIADEYGLWYISDSAQSLGATRSGRPAGAFADALVISFTVGKTVFAGEGAAIVTNNEGLYERLLWHTQHPLRQKKELGLSLSNEFGLNARMHPLAALWANSVWKSELKKLAKHQKESYRIIDKLNKTGFTENIPFESEKINPSFFRLTASWKNTENKKDNLIKKLIAYIGPTIIEDPLVKLIYQQPSFLARYKSRLCKNIHCPQAERQAQVRFCIIKDITVHSKEVFCCLERNDEEKDARFRQL